MSRRVSSVVAVSVLAMSGVLVAGSAGASDALERVSKELTYTCEFPLIGPQPVTATVSVDLPTSAPALSRIQPENLAIDFTLSENIVTAFRLTGAATMEADAFADVDLAYAGRQLTLGLPNLHAEKQNVPPSGPMTSQFTGPMPSFVLPQAGALDIAAGEEFVAQVEALDANGQPTGLGNPIPVPCTQDDGQDPHLGSITVTAAQAATAPAAAPVGTFGSIEKQLAYTCEFPQIGAQEAQGVVTATFPDQAQVGQRAAINDAKVTATFNTTTTDALRAVSAATVSGGGQVDLPVTLTDASGTLALTLGMPVVIPSVDVPATGNLTASVNINTPSLIFRTPGELSVSAGIINGSLTPLKADGTPTELGTFPVPCTPNAGQDTHLATVPIVG